jgi:hypothetical protein
MSEFNTADLPSYTKLMDTPLDLPLASATIGQDGTIYAASLDANTLKSELYKLDSVTFQPTLIGPSSDGYMDLAAAPGQPGNSLMAVFAGNTLNVDADNGDYYNWYYMFQNNLVGIAYVGTMPYQEYGYDTMLDWYFIIDQAGYVYLLGFLEQDGKYYYMEHDTLAPGGIYTVMDFQMETPYFGSAYFDDEMLYFSAYQQSRENVTLLAIDVAGGSKACYDLGNFETGVWPVVGLMELGVFENNIGAIMGTDAIETMARPTPVEQQTEVKGLRENKAQGGLNHSDAVMPLSDIGIKNERVYLDVTLPAAGTNARMSVSFDPTELELVNVEGLTEASAYDVDEISVYATSVELAVASADMIPADQTVFRLAFEPKVEGLVDVTIHTHELSDVEYWTSEGVDLVLPHNCPSANFQDVKETDWFHEAVDFVVEKGWMNGLNSTKFGPNDTMNRAQFVTVLYRMEGEPAVTNTGIFEDIANDQYYTNAVYWAKEVGITTGATENEFEPYGLLSRSQLVTFMYRYAKYKGYDVSAKADLSGFADAGKIQDYALTPWSWSVANGLVNGYNATTLAPMDLTNRSQAAAIFQRFAENIMN